MSLWYPLGLATVLSFVTGSRFPNHITRVWHPFLSCVVLTLLMGQALAAMMGTDLVAVLRVYMRPPMGAGGVLVALMSPGVVSFGFQLYGHRGLLCRSALPVCVSVLLNAVAGLFGTAAAVRLLALSPVLRPSLFGRFVTVPLAITIARVLQADDALAAVPGLVAGTLGIATGRQLMDALGVRDPVARGLALGNSVHAGGVLAVKDEPATFPFAACGLALNGAVSTLIVCVPVVRNTLLAIANVPTKSNSM